VVISTQHSPDISHEPLTESVIEEIIKPVLPKNMISRETRYLINPTGRFVIGGPMGDTGLTGRKIIVDTYGGYSRHGGGAFSGKDPSKVDRSAAYAARYVAKNIVAAGLAKKCELQVAYAIGVARPVSVLVETFGTGAIADEKNRQAGREAFRPAAQGHRPLARPAAADLFQDCSPRSFSAATSRNSLGKTRTKQQRSALMPVCSAPRYKPFASRFVRVSVEANARFSLR